MAYTRPSASAADASWLSASAYTRPAVTAADASFVVIGARAASTVGLVTQFGTPKAGMVQAASGSSTTSLGTPELNLNSTRLVTGFTQTSFGSAVAVYDQFLDASGFRETAFGGPKAGMVQAASGSSTTSLGTPELNLNSTRLVTGFTQTSFGSAVAVYDQFLDASGFRETAFGGPTSRRIQPATGELNTQFGIGLGRNVQRPTGFTTTQFGAPFLRPRPVGFRDTNFGQARLFPFHVAPGIHSTQFGTPTNRRTQSVTGIAPTTTFGTPSGFILQRAAGWMATNFGTPRLFPFHVAPGIHSTQFGPINGWQHWDEVWNPPATRFGTPTTPTNRTAQAAGFQSTRYGQPGKVSHKPDSESWLCIASGFGLVRISSPVATWPQSGSASGIAAGHLGTPKGIRGQRATGIHSMAVGAPSVKTMLKASGFASVHLGLAAAVMTQRAAGAQFVQRFGLPESDIGNTHKVYGINASGRIGNPTGFSRFNYRVTGFRPVSIGSASCHESHRAIHVTPICRLGTPILRRNAQC